MIRELYFRKILDRLEKRPSEVLRLIELRILTELTSKAFRVKYPGGKTRRPEKCGKALQSPEKTVSDHKKTTSHASHTLQNHSKTARNCFAPRASKTASGKALRAYALFTKQCMEDAGSEIDPLRLYSLSYNLGRKVRALTSFTDQEDLERLVFLLYRNIGITMKGNIPGILTVPACYFSHVYTPEQCSLISAMDAGIIAGICGDGTLHFSQRLTEGCPCCRAYFSGKELKPGTVRQNCRAGSVPVKPN